MAARRTAGTACGGDCRKPSLWPARGQRQKTECRRTHGAAWANIVGQVQRTWEHFGEDLMPQVVERIVEHMRKVDSQKRVLERSEKHVHVPVLLTLEGEIMEAVDEVVQTISQEPGRNRMEDKIVDKIVDATLTMQQEPGHCTEEQIADMLAPQSQKLVVGVLIHQMQENIF